MAYPRGTGVKNGPAKSREAPGVPGIIQGLDQDRSTLLSLARDTAFTLPGVEERTLYDGFCRHWTPAYYLGDGQLFHVHNFKAGLRATIFAGGKKLEPLILESEQVPEELRLQLAKSAGSRGVRQIKVNLESKKDVEALLILARLKWESLQ